MPGRARPLGVRRLVVVVFVTIAVWWSRRAWLVPVGGFAVTIVLWCLGVALMQTPPPQVGG